MKVGLQRNLQGISGKIVRLFSVIVILYHLYAAQFGAPEVLKFRPTHVAMFLSIVFMVYSYKKINKESYIPWYDYILIVLSWVPILYIYTNYSYIVSRYPYISHLERLDWLMAIIVIFLVVESCRRSIGYPLSILFIFFTLHALFGKYFPGPFQQASISPARLIDHLFLTTSGIWGTITGISATYVLMFVLLGVVLEEAKGGELFMNTAIATMGRSRGGPAKSAIIASGLFGSISGAAVANVYATGSFTIPLMIKTGFKPTFAAAVEAVASSSGQLVPPIMGSAVFLIANFTQTQYIHIATAAIIPAFLYLFAVYMMVHIEAVKNNLPALSIDMTRQARRDIIPVIHMGFSIVVVVFLLIRRYTPLYSAYMGILSTFLLAQIRPFTRMNIDKIFGSFEKGARRVAPIAAALFIASMIVGVIELSGLGLRFTSILLRISGGNLLFTLILVMFSCMVLGMGLPTAAAYLIVAIFGAPALIQLGVQPLVAHFFVFYYAIIANITPPVAVASYAAATIAETDMNKTGWKAVQLGLAVYIVPFVMIYNPALILIGTGWEILLAVITAIIGIMALSVFVQGYLFTRTSIWERTLTGFSAIFLLLGGLQTDIIGALFLTVVFVSQLKKALKKGNQTR